MLVVGPGPGTLRPTRRVARKAAPPTQTREHVRERNAVHTRVLRRGWRELLLLAISISLRINCGLAVDGDGGAHGWRRVDDLFTGLTRAHAAEQFARLLREPQRHRAPHKCHRADARRVGWRTAVHLILHSALHALIVSHPRARGRLRLRTATAPVTARQRQRLRRVLRLRHGRRGNRNRSGNDGPAGAAGLRRARGCDHHTTGSRRTLPRRTRQRRTGVDQLRHLKLVRHVSWLYLKTRIHDR